MRRPARIGALCGALTLLAACAGPAATVEGTEAGEESVDGGYYWSFFNAGDQHYGAFRVWLILKPSETDGRLRVCGLYAADVPEASQKILSAQMADPASYVGFSRTSGGRATVRINPGFMAFHRGDLPEKMSDLTASCLVTGEPWADWLGQPKVAFNLGSGYN